LRVPGWARNEPAPSSLYSYADTAGEPTRLSINGRTVTAAIDKSGYVSLERDWRTGDVVEISFPFAVRKVVAKSEVTHDRGRMAVERGPIVYCCEWPDVEGGNVMDLLFDAGAELKPSRAAGIYGGVDLLDTQARSVTNANAASKALRLIPYYLWANRGAGEMTVWLPTRAYAVGDIGPAGGLIFYDNPNHASDGWRYLEAAACDQSAGAPWGCFRTGIPGARGTAIGTGRQNTLDMLAACAEPGTAAALCAAYRLNGVGGWFLPSRDELALVYRHLHATGLGAFDAAGAADNFTYWTSSQQTADMSAHIDFADLGRQHGDDKDYPRRVRAIRAF
jgi:hypothetical protein